MAIYQWEATTDREEHEPLIDKNQKERDKMTTYKLFTENGRLRGPETITLNQGLSNLMGVKIKDSRSYKGSGTKDVYTYPDGSRSSKFKSNKPN